jgi:hypothetical protein
LGIAIIKTNTMLGALLELLIAFYGLFGELNILYRRKTNRITHHGRSLHITPDAPLLSYALARGPPPRSSFLHNHTDRCGGSFVDDHCSDNILAHVTDENCLSEGCIDIVWIWEGVAAHGNGKYRGFSKETLRLWDVWEEVTGQSAEAHGWSRCEIKDQGGGEDEQVDLVKDEL